MEQTKLKQLIIKVLKDDGRIWNENKTELNQTLLLDLVERIDEKIINLLLQEKELREKFFVKIKDVYVFKTNDFRFFMEENKVDNSYTAYKNRIGLTDGKRFLKDTNNIVLNFPYKDCVLEGGQSTEEGTDIHFQYNEKTKQYEEKQDKRKEIFFNQVLAHDEIDRLFDPKAFTNWKRFTKDGEQEVKEIKRDEDGMIKENLIIKGNNLLALHSLKKQFAGKVKLIYIDPPYNTGNDGFKYNDNFNHSTWLTFMKNRLEIAKELLKDDGVIFIHCDDNEQAYLKVLMDEIFGTNNFINNIINQSANSVFGSKASAKEKTIIKTKDYILFYKKNNLIKLNPLFTKSAYPIHKSHDFVYENGEKISTVEWFKNNYQEIFNKYNLDITKENIVKLMKIDNKFGQDAFKKLLDIQYRTGGEYKQILPKEIELKLNKGEIVKYNNLFLIKENNGKGKSSFLRSLRESCNYTDDHYSEYCKADILGDVWNTSQGYGNIGIEGNVEFTNGKKPEEIIKNLLKLTTESRDIILDYHLGSGTTCAVAHKMGRQYIGIEQMDYVETITIERLKKVIEGEQSGISKSVNWQGGGDFIYFELAKWNETAKEKILSCNKLDELITFFDEMCEIYFLNYNLKITEFKEKVINEEEFKNLSLDEQKKMFIAMLDNNQMYVNKTEMEDKKFGIDKRDQELTSQFYNSER